MGGKVKKGMNINEGTKEKGPGRQEGRKVKEGTK